MKKSTIVILMFSAVLLGILSGVLVNVWDDNRLEEAQVNEIRKVNELIDDKLASENKIINDVISTNGADVKLSPNAVVWFQKHYTDCGHTIINKEQINTSEVNKDEDYFKDAYSDWAIESFNSDEIRLYKEVNGICDKHYIIKTKDDHIAIYTVDNEGNTKLKEVTDIPVQYLPSEDIALLEQGITANGDNELARKLEDYE